MEDIKIPNLQELKKYNKKQLDQLAIEIRKVIADLSSKKSIHFSSNLGIVELSIALLYIFDSPKDQIMYDTGHQSYVHKILTDRYNQIYSIRDDNGLSGFQEPNESEHDFISTGHSGNMLSIAQGLNEYKENDRLFIPIIGDASISNGLSFEALNNISFNKTKMIIVINDNEMSISKNVGALHKMMSKIKTSNINFFGGNFFRNLFKNNKKIYFFFSKISSWFEQLFTKNNFFISMNYKYIGPVDGHNIKKLIYALKKAKFHCENKPVILHVRTKKGFGFSKAEIDKLGKYHAASIKSLDNSDNNKDLSFGDVANNYLIKLNKENNDIYIINPAMTYSTGFIEFANTYSNHYEDVGIAEEHAVTKAVGICKNNKRPYVVIYSTFLQRTYDQIHHDVARNNLPITFIIDRADISYGDGNTHHGIYDIAFLKTIPNTIITAPRNKHELQILLDLSYKNKTNPFFIRYPKEVCDLTPYEYKFEFGDWIFLQKNKGAKTLIISYGTIINQINDSVKNKNVDIINAVFLTKYNIDKVKGLLKTYKNIYVIEKVYYQNNLFSDLLVIKNEFDFNCKLKSICIKTDKIGHGSKKVIDKKLKIDIDSILEEIEY